MLIVNIWPSFHFITKSARPTRLDEKQIVISRVDLELSGQADQRCDLAHGALSTIRFCLDGRGSARLKIVEVRPRVLDYFVFGDGALWAR